MIDTYILLGLMLMLPFLIKTVVLRFWPQLDSGAWVNILFSCMFVVGLVILLRAVFSVPEQSAMTVVKFQR